MSRPNYVPGNFGNGRFKWFIWDELRQTPVRADGRIRRFTTYDAALRACQEVATTKKRRRNVNATGTRGQYVHLEPRS